MIHDRKGVEDCNDNLIDLFECDENHQVIFMRFFSGPAKHDVLHVMVYELKGHHEDIWCEYSRTQTRSSLMVTRSICFDSRKKIKSIFKIWSNLWISKKSDH